MRFSVVRISLVRSLKKIQKNLAYADFHQSSSLGRKISMIQIRISISQITISMKKRGISLKKTNLKSETKCKQKIPILKQVVVCVKYDSNLIHSEFSICTRTAKVKLISTIKLPIKLILRKFILSCIYVTLTGLQIKHQNSMYGCAVFCCSTDKPCCTE